MIEYPIHDKVYVYKSINLALLSAGDSGGGRRAAAVRGRGGGVRGGGTYSRPSTGRKTRETRRDKSSIALVRFFTRPRERESDEKLLLRLVLRVLLPVLGLLV